MLDYDEDEAVEESGRLDEEDSAGDMAILGGCKGVPSKSPKVPPFSPASITLVNSFASFMFL